MDLRVLQYALAVYEQKSFTKAAQTLHMAQPSLSQQIAKLEDELGFPLFKRGSKPIESTPMGLLILQKAEKMIQMRDDLLWEAREKTQGMGHTLRIGAPVITGGHILPPLLKAFDELYPEVRVSLVEDTTDQLERQAAEGLVDLAILPLPIEDERLGLEVMLQEKLLLAVPPEKKEWLPPITTVTALQDVQNAPWILLKKGYGFRRVVLDLCASSGFSPHVLYETSSIETAQSLVAHGLGITLVPEMILRKREEPKPIYLPLEPQPQRTVAFVFLKDRYLSLAARAFINIQRANSARTSSDYHEI